MGVASKANHVYFYAVAALRARRLRKMREEGYQHRKQKVKKYPNTNTMATAMTTTEL